MDYLLSYTWSCCLRTSPTNVCVVCVCRHTYTYIYVCVRACVSYSEMERVWHGQSHTLWVLRLTELWQQAGVLDGVMEALRGDRIMLARQGLLHPFE